MKKSKKPSVDRRSFFKSAAAGAAALATSTPAAKAQREAGETRPAVAGGVPAPTQEQLARDAGNVRPPSNARAVTRPGSDLMVQAIRNLGIEFVAAQAGSTFEGLQESVINYGKPPNKMPEFITALHEESAVAMAHGYAKAEAAILNNHPCPGRVLVRRVQDHAFRPPAPSTIGAVETHQAPRAASVAAVQVSPVMTEDDLVVELERARVLAKRFGGGFRQVEADLQGQLEVLRARAAP